MPLPGGSGSMNDYQCTYNHSVQPRTRSSSTRARNVQGADDTTTHQIELHSRTECAGSRGHTTTPDRAPLAHGMCREPKTHNNTPKFTINDCSLVGLPMQFRLKHFPLSSSSCTTTQWRLYRLWIQGQNFMDVRANQWYSLCRTAWRLNSVDAF